MREHTRPIPGFPGYEVSADGRVYSVGTNWRGYGRRRMRAFPSRCGYLRVRLTVDGERRRITVHKAVALAFLGPKPSSRHELRHLNGDRRDNRASNLAWGTQQDNANDRDAHGRTSRGPRHSEAIKRGLARRSP